MQSAVFEPTPACATPDPLGRWRVRGRAVTFSFVCCVVVAKIALDIVVELVFLQRHYAERRHDTATIEFDV